MTNNPDGLSDARARQLLAQAFEDAGVTGYARHILSGRCDWFWTKPALAAIEAATPPAITSAAIAAGEIDRALLAEVMQDAWGEICDDSGSHPLDMKHGRGSVLFYSPGHWTDLIALRLNERLAAAAPKAASEDDTGIRDALRQQFRTASRGHGRAGTAELRDGPYMSMDDAANVYADLMLAGRILQDADGYADENTALNLLRSREMQAIGAAISTRNWHDLEAAYNQGRDRLDSILIARKLGERKA